MGRVSSRNPSITQVDVMKGVFEINYGGFPIRYRFRYSQTAHFFMPYAHLSKEESFDIMASEEHIKLYRDNIPESKADSYVEYKSLIGLTSIALIPHHRCIFHAAAFCWRGRAWLLTAPSGTGKTTQLNNWLHSHPNEISVICGDMPCIEVRDNGIVWVHPSPWNGKERRKGRLSAPLGGIIYLKQDRFNQIQKLSPQESVPAILYQLQVRPDNETQIREVAWLADRILRASPVWLFSNMGNIASTEFLRAELSNCFFSDVGGKDGDV